MPAGTFDPSSLLDRFDSFSQTPDGTRAQAADRTMVIPALLKSSISMQKLNRIHLLDRLLLLSAQELGSSSPSMMLALSPPTLLRPAALQVVDA